MVRSSSVFIRLIVLLIITIVISTIVTNLVVASRLEYVLEEELYEETFVILQSLDWAMRPLLEDDNSEAIQRLIDNISAYPIVQELRLYSADQSVSYSNNDNDIGQRMTNQCVEFVFENNALKHSYKDLEAGIFEAAIPVRGSSFQHEAGSDIQAVLYMAADTDYVKNLWKSISDGFQVVFVSANLIILILVGTYIYFFMGRPLNEFTKASRAIAEKDYDYHINKKLHGEFEDFRKVYEQMQIGIKAYTSELALAKLKAEEASEAKMIFLTNMSHEIRTPLNSILGFTEILEEQERDADKKSELKIIHKSGKHLLTVINDLLDFSKIESNQMDIENIVFNIREMVRDVSDIFGVQFNKNSINYHYEVDCSVPSYCNGDANKIRQILINLINNAIKFTKEGEVIVKLKYEQPMLSIEVSDTGIGISEHKVDKIFDAFSQSDNSIARKYGGTGLGLAICKKFAKMLGGDITVHSILGEGTTFKVVVQVVELENTKLLGRSMLCKWLNEDSELSDLVHETVLTLPERIEMLMTLYTEKMEQKMKEEVHALKGLTGNFQMTELYSLFIAADKCCKEQTIDYALLGGIFKDIEEIVLIVHVAAMNHCAMQTTGSESKIKADRKPILKKEMTILVAEDIKENQLLMSKILEPLTDKIAYADNGKEAMTLLRERHYDCLLLDIQMPEMSGEDVLLEIRRLENLGKFRHRPYIIVVTAHATLDEKNRCLAMGADDYISKPVDKTKLRNMIRGLSNK